MSAINQIGAASAPMVASETGGLARSTSADGVSFGDLLQRAVAHAAASGNAADLRAQALAAGASDDIHGTMIAGKQAEIELKLVGAVRNKLLDAFHELWRTNL